LRIFKTKWFVRFARREGIDDDAIREAVGRAEKGLIDADLGGGVVKRRVARPHEGKSGGFRSIVLFRAGERAFFVYGFPKSERESIRKDELEGFRKLAGEMLGYDDATLAKAVKGGALQEVRSDEQE
jgi:hypothetical protein